MRRDAYKHPIVRIVLVAVCGLSAAPPAAADTGSEARRTHPLEPAIAFARKSLKLLENVQDYEATFIKREWIGRELVTQTMHLKVRENPFSVYLRFIKPSPGREVIYVDGRNNGMLLVHEVGVRGLVGTLSLRPDDRRVMEENRYPITKIGLRNLLRALIRQWEFESRYGEVEVKYYPNAEIGRLPCKAIEVSHPRPRRQFPYHIVRVYFDRKTNLPVRVERYGFPSQPGAAPPLVEEYTYLNLRTNVGLTDRDFDPRNPDYGF